MLVSKQKSQPSFQLFAANNKQMCTKTNFLNSFYDYAIKSFHLSPLLPQLPVFAGDQATWSLTSEDGGHTHHLLLTAVKSSRLYFSFQKFCSFAQNQWSDYKYDYVGGQNQAFWHQATISPFYQFTKLFITSRVAIALITCTLRSSTSPHWDCCHIIGGLKTTYRLISISYGPPETSRPSAAQSPHVCVNSVIRLNKLW